MRKGAREGGSETATVRAASGRVPTRGWERRLATSATAGQVRDAHRLSRRRKNGRAHGTHGAPRPQARQRAFRRLEFSAMGSAVRAAVGRLPAAPGVYRFRDARGRALYIGRATALRHRVGSYWTDLGDRRHLV